MCDLWFQGQGQTAHPGGTKAHCSKQAGGLQGAFPWQKPPAPQSHPSSGAEPVFSVSPGPFSPAGPR